MSILIKGMEMPENCTRCDYIGLNVAIGCPVMSGLNGRATDCPLVLPNNKINKLMMSLEEKIKNEREMAVKSLSLSVDNPRHIESVYNAYANGMENALEYIIYYLGDFIDECDN